MKPAPFYSNELILKLQAKLAISDRKTKQAANMLRVECGKMAVEKGLATALTDSNRKLKNHFELNEINVNEKVRVQD